MVLTYLVELICCPPGDEDTHALYESQQHSTHHSRTHHSSWTVCNCHNQCYNEYKLFDAFSESIKNKYRRCNWTVACVF